MTRLSSCCGQCSQPYLFHWMHRYCDQRMPPANLLTHGLHSLEIHIIQADSSSERLFNRLPQVSKYQLVFLC